MAYNPTQYVSNPLLAAYAVPPALPRLVDSRANRPRQYRETYGRQTTRLGVDPPGVSDYNTMMPPPPPPERVVRYGSGSDDGADPNDEDELDGADPNVDDDFDDRGEIRLEFQGEHVHPAEPSPYIETVERIHHSRFHGSTLDQDAVTAHLITEPQCEGSQSATATLFEWM
ncbi:MAG: hypothetical protein Q9199_000821 [Rusavskia elegans]